VSVVLAPATFRRLKAVSDRLSLSIPELIRRALDRELRRDLRI